MYRLNSAAACAVIEWSARHWLFSSVLFRSRRCWIFMSSAPPPCTTHRDAQLWTARACRQAWRSCMRWSWRGRRCTDTAKRRDEAEGSRHIVTIGTDPRLRTFSADTFGPNVGKTQSLGCEVFDQPVALKGVLNVTPSFTPVDVLADQLPVGLFLIWSFLLWSGP